MFRAKSIFVKYMVTFMLIIVICFAVISFTITFIIRSYGTDVKTEYLSNVANSAAVYIENDFSDSYATFKDYLFDNGQGLKSVLELLAVNDDDMLRSGKSFYALHAFSCRIYRAVMKYYKCSHF